MVPPPSIGRIVVYRSRTGTYSCPAMITAVQASLSPHGLRLFEETDGRKGVRPLTSAEHVHLTVFTPGLAGEYDTEVVARPDDALLPNLGGSYQEFDVPFFDAHGMRVALGEYPGDGEAEQLAGSWRWPERY